MAFGLNIYQGTDKKKYLIIIIAIRTANHHRCSGREDQGVRVILRQGTRQISDRNFGIRSADRKSVV